MSFKFFFFRSGRFILWTLGDLMTQNSGILCWDYSKYNVLSKIFLGKYIEIFLVGFLEEFTFRNETKRPRFGRSVINGGFHTFDHRNICLRFDGFWSYGSIRLRHMFNNNSMKPFSTPFNLQSPNCQFLYFRICSSAL